MVQALVDISAASNQVPHWQGHAVMSQPQVVSKHSRWNYRVCGRFCAIRALPDQKTAPTTTCRFVGANKHSSMATGDLITQKEAAAILNRSVSVVSRAIRDGRLDYIDSERRLLHRPGLEGEA